MKLLWSDFKFGLKIGFETGFEIGFETRFETGFGLGCQSGQNGVDGVVWVERGGWHT